MNRKTVILQLAGEKEERIFRDVPYGDYTAVVHILEYIRLRRYRDLSYRYSCHHGSCGTCGVEVNGKRVLACLARLKDFEDPVRIAPLSGFPQEGGLVVDTSTILRDFPEDARYLTASDAEGNPPVEVSQFVKLERCIECGLCESSCPVTKRFIGPAALAAHWRELQNNPSRRGELLERVAQPEGVGACEKKYACTRSCPAGVNPGKAIWQLRKLTEERVLPGEDKAAEKMRKNIKKLAKDA